MSYFKNFPTIYYEFDGDIKTVIDITRNVRVIKGILDSITLYETYDIEDGETPEIISEKIYGTPYYNWVLMILNDRYDYISDFPLAQPELDKYITEKYGIGNEDEIHHYINNGFIVDSLTPGAAIVTNRQHEQDENEKKRSIKVVSPNVMARLVKQFQNII